MKWYKIFLMIVLLGSSCLRGMETTVKELFPISASKSPAVLCSALQHFAILLIRQDELMSLAQQELAFIEREVEAEQKLDVLSHKKRLSSAVIRYEYFIAPKTEIGAIASLSLAKLIQNTEVTSADFPKRGEPGYLFLYAQDPEIAYNDDIQKIRTAIFSNLTIEETKKETKLITNKMDAIYEEALKFASALEFVYEKVGRYIHFMKDYIKVRNDHYDTLMKADEENTRIYFLIMDSFLNDEKNILSNYFVHRHEYNQLYQNITKTLRSTVLHAIRNKKKLSDGGNWYRYTDSAQGIKFPATFTQVQDQNVYSKQAVIEEHVPKIKKTKEKKHLNKNRTSQEKTYSKLPAKKRQSVVKGKQKIASSPAADEIILPREEVQQTTSVHEILAVRSEQSSEQSSSSQSLIPIQASQEQPKQKQIENPVSLIEIATSTNGDDHSFIIDKESCVDYITVADPKNNLKLCLYRAALFNPVTQDIDRKGLWQTYTSNVKQWFIDHKTVLQQQGYLNPLNTKRYVKNEYEARLVTKKHSFALVIDEFLKQLGNQHPIDSRLPGQTEQDLCVTVPGHFQELDVKNPLTRTCLFVFLQNGITKRWYHRMIEEKSKHLLVEEYLRDGYNNIAFPPLEYVAIEK